MTPITRDQAREIDRRCVEEFGMNSLMLMENAARGCVETATAAGVTGKIVICCGKGNNGGDGFAVARMLEADGADVRVLLYCAADDLTGDAAFNFGVLEKSKTPLTIATDHPREAEKYLSACDWIFDALLGTGVRGEPRAPFDSAIAAINAAPAKVFAIDLPSGLDCDTGVAAKSTVRADVTCTFVAPKVGFVHEDAVSRLGRVYVSQIGAPRRLLDDVLSCSRTHE